MSKPRTTARARHALGATFAAGLAIAGVAAGEAFPSAALAAEFDQQVQPLLRAACAECHGAKPIRNELDLGVLDGLAAARTRAALIADIALRVRDGDMPPAKAKRALSAPEKERLLAWSQRLLDAEAREKAGDPGPVPLRRLTNAEYDNAIRELTGVDLRPSRDFPADSQTGEGFTNSAAALELGSPAQIAMYHGAARAIAAHAVLLPDGIRFSKGETRIEWIEEAVAPLRAFHASYGGTAGEIPVAAYVAATIKHRARLATGGAAFAEVTAVERLSSATYLRTLWAALNATDPSPLLDEVRARWRAATDAKPVMEAIASWQKDLWVFTKGDFVNVGSGEPYVRPGLRVVASEPVRVIVRVPGSEGQTPAAPRPGVDDNDKRKIPDWTWHLVAAQVAPAQPGARVIVDRLRLEGHGKPTIVLSEVPELKARVEASSGLRFGQHPAGGKTPAGALVIPAPGVLKIGLPGNLAFKRNLVADVAIDPGSAEQTTVQARFEFKEPKPADIAKAEPSRALIAHPKQAAARARSYDDMRALFPAAIFYPAIQPTDAIIAWVLFHREDEPLRRLMLDDAGRAELDRLWREILFVGRKAPREQEHFGQFLEFLQQHDRAFEFEHFASRIEAEAKSFAAEERAAEPRHLDALVAFAARAWRRPLEQGEERGLRAAYAKLRADGKGHEESIRAVLARVLASPHFLLKVERAPSGERWQPVGDVELAARLSFFLWASIPDAELTRAATAGELRDSARLEAQVRRMLKDPRVRGMAAEFGAQWMHVRGFAHGIQKSEKLFPDFVPALRAAMEEEAILLFQDLFQEDRPVLSLFAGDAIYANEQLTRHYGIGGVAGPEMRRIAAAPGSGRGGLLGMGATLAQTAGAGRTSPILRGLWVAEQILGEHFPKPPADVKPLPEDESTTALSVRQLTEKHSLDPLCAGCHRRIDPYGYALEEFDAIGRRRGKDAAGRALDVRVALPDGTMVDGAAQLRAYIVDKRRADVLRTFTRKLLGYALGRPVILSDQPLIDAIAAELQRGEGRVSAAVLAIVRSEQFRCIRPAHQTSAPVH